MKPLEPSTDIELALAGLAMVLGEYRWPTDDERVLQAHIGQVLRGLGLAFERERPLDAHSRIDFYLPDNGIGIEVKVDGSPSAVLRQVARYARHPDIRALVVFTTRRRVAALIPMALHGRLIRVVTTWEAQL